MRWAITTLRDLSRPLPTGWISGSHSRGNFFVTAALHERVMSVTAPAVKGLDACKRTGPARMVGDTEVARMSEPLGGYGALIAACEPKLLAVVER
jgi:hypothetical protein